jgi:xanthine dehydrogenase molybdenum-binding subunit
MGGIDMEKTVLEKGRITKEAMRIDSNSSSAEFKWVGQPIPQKESKEKVTGRAMFVADMRADLYAKILRSPYPHAMIERIDFHEAAELPGVEAIVTHEDVPKRLVPRSCARPFYILEDHLRYVGDEVAAVAAVSQEIAEKALDLIKVEYKLLPAVFDVEEAIKEDAPKLYPEGNVYGPVDDPYAVQGKYEPSVLSWGDIEAGFKEADLIVEDQFEVNSQIHSALEPHVCVAKWEGGQLTLWISTQTKTEVMECLSYVFDVPLSNVRVLAKYVGGGFGSKYIERYVPIAALLSRKAGGKAVKLLYTREEEQCHSRRAAQKIRVKIGARNDGKITAVYFKSLFDLGAYGNSYSGSCLFWEEAPALAYQYRNARFEAWDVHTNLFSAQSMRGVLTPGVSFGIEQTIEQVAERLGLSPLEIRERNMTVTGDMGPPVPYNNDTNLNYPPRAALEAFPSKDLLRAVAEEIGWSEKWRGWGKATQVDGAKRRGIGISYTQGWGGFNYDGYMTQAVSMYPDGSLVILSGNQDLGTGSNTTLPMIAAEYLGLELDDVTILAGDTLNGTYDYFEARSSRTMTISGHLVLLAIDDAKRKIFEIAAPMLEVSSEELELKHKEVFVKNEPEKSLPLRSVLTSTLFGSSSGATGSAFPDVAEGFKTRNLVITAAEVEVDVETGVIKVIRLIPGACPGRMINPGMVLTLYRGGAVMGLGMALYEKVNFDRENNLWLSRSFMDYKLPTAVELPEITPVVLERTTEGRPPNVGGPYGARGVGEWGVSQVVPAIANAVYCAIGTRLKQSPMTGETVLEAIMRGGQ